MRKILLFLLVAMAGTPLLMAQDKLLILVDGSADVGGDADAEDGKCADMNGNCTLRAAIDVANAASGKDVTIVLPGRLPGGNTGTYTLSNVAPDMSDNTYEDANEFGDLDISGDFASLTLIGTGRPGPQVTISPNDRVFDVLTTAPVRFERIWISGGTARAGNNGSSDGSGVGVDGEDGADGGGMRIGENADVTIEQVTFSGNTTQSGGNGAAPATTITRTRGGDAGDGGNGGGLCIRNGATVVIRRSNFIGNGTGDGGSPAAGQSNMAIELTGGNGGDGGNGGAIYNAGELTLESCTVWNNTGGSPSTGAAGSNNGPDGITGEGGSGGGIANATGMGGTPTNEGTLSLKNTIVAGNVAGDDTSNGKQPGMDLFDATDGGTITLMGDNLIGSNDAVTSHGSSSLIGTADAPVDPVITGQNSGGSFAVPVATLGNGSPAVDAGATIVSEFDYDSRGYVRPAEGGAADIGGFELNATTPDASLALTEIDVVDSNPEKEFAEIKNNGDYPVQVDEYVLVCFDNSGTACFVTNLYGQLMPGELFTIGDSEVSYMVEQNLSFDVVGTSNCEGSANNQFIDQNGAIALYEGDGGTFTGIMAGSKSDARVDVIVYDNSIGVALTEGKPGGDFPALGKMMDLCGAFGQSSDCAGADAGDNSSIQRTDTGALVSGEPSPGSPTSAALPVEWLSFTGVSPKAGTVDLKWRTLAEQNNAGFAVEHRCNGQWVAKAWVPGAGTNGETQAYRTALTDIATGVQAFRLRQEDYDGATDFSDIVMVTVEGDADLKLFPNPSSGPMSIVLQDAVAGTYHFSIIDAAGRELRVWQTELASPGVLRAEVNTGDLLQAPYFLRMVGPQGVSTLPFSVR